MARLVPGNCVLVGGIEYRVRYDPRLLKRGNLVYLMSKKHRLYGYEIFTDYDPNDRFVVAKSIRGKKKILRSIDPREIWSAEFQPVTKRSLDRAS